MTKELNYYKKLFKRDIPTDDLFDFVMIDYSQNQNPTTDRSELSCTVEMLYDDI